MSATPRRLRRLALAALLGGSTILIGPPALSSDGDLVWIRDTEGPSFDAASAVAIDANGNVVVAGGFRHTVDFDPGIGITNLTASGALGETDIAVWKYDSDGNLLWAIRAGADASEGAFGVAVDDDGNVLVTGSFYETVDFDPGPATTTLTSTGYTDTFIWKLDPDGNFLWVRAVGSSAGDGIAVDHDGNVVVIDDFTGTVDFDPGVGITNLTSNGSNDIFVLKLDSDGDLVWVKQAGGTGIDVPRDVRIDGDGAIVVTGAFANTVDFDPGAGTTTLISNGGGDIFVWKLDSAGNLVWARAAGGIGSDLGWALATSRSGDILITGAFVVEVDFDPGPGTYNLDGLVGKDAFAWKLDSDGDFVWARHAGTANEAEGRAIAVASDGAVLVAGTFRGTGDFDPGAGTKTLSNITNYTDAFVWEFTEDGSFVRAFRIGGFAGDGGQGAAIDESGNRVIVGYFTGTTDFDPGVGTVNRTATDIDDAFVLVLEGPSDTDGDGFPDDVDNFPTVVSVCRNRQATMIGTAGPNTLIGTGAADVIMGFGSNDIINAGGGDDLICAGDGADVVHGGDGKDKIYGENGSDTLYGDEKSDHLYGGNGTDTLRGNGGTRDRLFGGDGIDNLNGGTGTDDRCTTGEAYSACEVVF